MPLFFAKPLSRNVRCRGSRSVAKRFSAPHGAEYFTAYGLFPIGCLVFSFANIVTFHFRVQGKFDEVKVTKKREKKKEILFLFLPK